MERLTWLLFWTLLCHYCVFVTNQSPRDTLPSVASLLALNSSKIDIHETLPSASLGKSDLVWSASDEVDITTSPFPLPIISNCYAYIKKFSDSAAEFTKCSILFSRPLRFCENCVNEFIAATQTYNAIVEGSSQDDAGASCSDVVLGSDRIQIIRRSYKFIKEIWDDSYCDGCFFGYNVNTTKPELNNATLHFMQLSNETAECFDNYTHGAQFEPFVVGNGSVDPVVCDSCREKYYKLNQFYHHLSEDHADHVCMDIVDMMNYTRLLWSKELKCTRHHVDNIPVILLSVLFCSLPILFYTANKIHGTKAAKKLLKQKRLHEAQLTTSLQEETPTTTPVQT